MLRVDDRNLMSTMIITVGDQIFALNQQIKRLQKQCQRYESALRSIAAGDPAPESRLKSCNLAREALAEVQQEQISTAA